MGSVLGGHHVLNGEFARGTLRIRHHLLNGEFARGTLRIKWAGC